MPISGDPGPTRLMCYTTNSKKRDHLRGIDDELLLKTFQDAIVMTRLLVIRYSWIKSLFIFQNDAESSERYEVGLDCSTSSKTHISWRKIRIRLLDRSGTKP